MKEWEKHVACDVGPGHEKHGLTWCGKNVKAQGFVFQSVDHAAFNGLARGRLVVCADCFRAIVEALSEGVDLPEPDRKKD